MKNTIILILFIMSMFAIAACSGNRVDEDVHVIEDAHNTHIDLPEFGSIDDGSPTIGAYTYMPIEAIQVREAGENEFTGKLYFTHIFTPEFWINVDDGTISHLEAWVSHEGNYENFDSIALVGVDSVEEWDVENNIDGFLIFFRFVGYSDDFGLAYGIYEAHEEAPPFFDPYN